MHLPLQNSRLLAITLPTEVENVFLTHCEAEEKLSSSFDIHMTLTSTNAAIDPNSLIGKSVTVEINTSIDEEPRYFNGIVQSFVIGAMEEGLCTYNAKATSWLSFLDLAVDCRIFQHKTVPEIVTGILQEYGYNDFDTSRLHNKYKPLEYCTQYCESTFNFINRLLAEAGIFYFFKHTKDKHILMLGDTSIAMPKCYEKEIQFHPQGNLRDQYLFAWHRNYKSYAGKTAHIDYDFENPYVTLVGKQGKQAKSKFAQRFEVYHPDFHKNIDEANAKASMQFEAYEAEHNLVEGGGTYSRFTCGGCFTFPESSREADSSEYFLTRVSHIATDNSFVMNDAEETLSQGYQNFFTCIPKITPYRTYPYKFDKPHILGPQPALVVGPKGEEIYTDKYGRVKIHFYWSRQGNKDEQSSCWVRVAQLWAGQGYGMFFLPRIGQEVIVEFYNGDPDKPIIMGSVYNGEYLPPYELPANKTQSGIKTRSSKGGAAKDANELRFEDQKDNEEIYLHAQRDYKREIEHCETAIIINGDHKMEVKSGSSVLEASESIEFKVGDNSILLTRDKIILQGKAIFLNDV